MNTRIIAASAAVLISATSFAGATTFAVKTLRDSSAQSVIVNEPGQMDGMAMSGSAAISQESGGTFVTTFRDASPR